MVIEDPSLLPSRGVVMVRGYGVVLGARSEERVKSWFTVYGLLFIGYWLWVIELFNL